MNSKKWVKIWLMTLITINLAYAGGILYLDPLQIFHKAPFSKNLFYKDQIVHNAGIINSYDFDSIILGTSMLENTSSKEASALLDSNFVNLSISGSKLADRAFTLNYALNKKEIKNVIISLDRFGKVGEYRVNNAVDSYSFLYNDSSYDDIKVYANPKYLLIAVCQVAKKYIEYCSNKFKSIENLNEWFSNKKDSIRFGGIDNWIKSSDNPQVERAFKKILKKVQCIKDNNCAVDKAALYTHTKESFDSYIFKYAQLNPDTKFHLVFPPYSRLRYALWKQANTGEFELYESAINYIVKKTQSLENISVYGFDHLSFVDDISNYQDTGHYHPNINSMMLSAIKNKIHVLTPETVNLYIEKVKNQAQAYNIENITDKIKLAIELKPLL